MLTVYGLKNCDTCRKAQKWLKEKKVAFHFKDVRADGLTLDQLTQWSEKISLDVLLNKRGTTWRTLDESLKNFQDEASALQLIVDHPALLKRPVFLFEDQVIVGFTKKQQDELNSLL